MISDTDFRRMLRAARNGGRAETDGDAARLLDLFRGMAVVFLKRRGAPLGGSVVDDLAGAVFLNLLERKTIPKDYPWPVWVRYALVRAWRDHTQANQPLGEIPLDALDFSMRARGGVPVPVAVNSRLLAADGLGVLRRRVRALGPQEEPERAIWDASVGALLEFGEVREPESVALHYGIPVEAARKIVYRAVVQTRVAFEDMYGAEVRSEGCQAGRELAERVFGPKG